MMSGMSPATPTALVEFLGVPVRMFEAAAEQWQGMLREYALRGLGGRSQPYSPDEIALAGAAVAAVLATADVDEDALVADLAVDLGADLVAGLSILQGVLDDARQLIIDGDLLMLPPLPELIALRNWICEQATEQAAGANPVPWRLDAKLDDPADTTAAEWDASLVPPADIAWLVGDDRNRIVAASPAALALLGWEEGALVGQRLLVVIPHSLREAHIAGFTRSVVTEGGDLLGEPLALPALARDGSEIPITLTLTRHSARAGRHVYLARLDHRG